ncbi:Flp pilus assembly complex ATPase component TadA [Facklamia sp. DSM 111018]|uniref:Flp pilus assembly complex ATPase component TadA n=1 Tax=Facklamia lactis TaxID=2749967 RepID=A0ABS0LR74_9LACT|nr:competence type IV pilus ATPase ComGA [Facklamia lactis]MBG9980972.1 Flp pilus assembly complex ATPase component TadA [Facklamia lactis]MBG9986665.1 Flp pilus assembly complex ATPase component TadA [Facklamia lactis]
MIENDAHKLIQKAILYQVSDIHIMPASTHYRIYFRINGQLIPQKQVDLNLGKRLISYFKYLANMDVGEKRKPQSGACDFLFDEEMAPIELRLSTISDVHILESLVIRIIFSHFHQASRIQCYFPQVLELLRQFIRRKSGLILISGPVGSGKTTTIYQLLSERMDQEALQVITMEDPVEIKEERFLQTQVNYKAGITYDLLIKSALRHHPDVLFIGEIRDEETARMTVRGALTGHLMIATIHATNCLGVIGRLEELDVTPQQIEQTLIAVISQRLIPRHCPFCRSDNLLSCLHFEDQHKRAAIFEILYDSDLKSLLSKQSNLNFSSNFIPLNHSLRKAWAYGYINKKQFHHFEII